MTKTKLPTYALVAIDLYQNHMSIENVAKKYQKSIRQIKDILRKSIKSKLPMMFTQIHKGLHQEKMKDIPQYVEVSIYMCQNKTDINKTATVFKKTTKQIKDHLRQAKLRLPMMYEYIQNQVIK